MATIAVHGGAGRATEAQRPGIAAALTAGQAALERGSALDAVCAAVVILELDGRFNAGRGAVRTRDGRVELDAAVMTGHDRKAGCVAAMTSVEHPILVARAVLETNEHVFLVGAGADQFAHARGIGEASPRWFTPADNASPAGTVGAVAVDDAGRCAVATSTGGMSGQVAGRVGDSPIIGAGTYADASCAISATGDGEAFIRAVFAHSVATAVRAGQQIADACADALASVVDFGATGGCIAITADGEVAIEHTTKGMPAGWATTTGDFHVQLSAQ